MHVKPTGPNRVEQPRLSLRALIPRYTRQFHMKKKQKQIIYISMFIYQMNWPIWKIIATGWMLCRPFEISHFTMFTTFRLSIRKKTTKSNWQIWTHNLFQLNGKWMGREGPTGLWIHVRSAVRTPAVQSIRLTRPSINKNLQNFFFFRQELNPNSRISAARPSMDVHLPARRRSASSFPHPSQSICWPRPSSFINFLTWFFPPFFYLYQGLRQDEQYFLALLRREHLSGRCPSLTNIRSRSGESAGWWIRIHSAPFGRRQPGRFALLAGPRSRIEFAGRRAPFHRPLGVDLSFAANWKGSTSCSLT